MLTLDLAPEERSAAIGHANAADAKIINSIELGANFIGSDVERKITQLYGGSTRFDFTPYFGTMDLVFVDEATATKLF